MSSASDLWLPQIADGSQPLYQRLSESIASAILYGELEPGRRLPPHRELAFRISASVGTVTRAYDELARRGLIYGTIGRGSFVADLNAERRTEIDLSRNVPPIGPARLALRETMASLRNRHDWADGLAYGLSIGADADRAAGLAWLKQTCRLDTPRSSHLFCTNGAHTALIAALFALARPGDPILCEAAAYSGLIEIALQFGFVLRPVALDHLGMCPEALARSAAETGAKVAVIMPTLQNPTARTMNQPRRDAIVAIARKQGLFLIEDDVHGCFADQIASNPLANIAPERTIYINSLSKALAPGLRSGFMVVPDGPVSDNAVRVLSSLVPSSAGLGQAIANNWIQSGRAYEILKGVQLEAEARAAIVTANLGSEIELQPVGTGLHSWWPMAAEKVSILRDLAKREGILINGPHAFAAEPNAENCGVRVCVGGAPNQTGLDRATSLLAKLHSGRPAYSGSANF